MANVCVSASGASATTCCVYHVNVHSCPQSSITAANGGMCGPWIAPSGKTFTHSEVKVGNITDGVWYSQVNGLHELGATSIIAHFKVAKSHLALHKQITVIKQTSE